MVAPQQVLLACNQTPNPITTGNVTRLQESDAGRSLVTLKLELLLRQQRHDPAGDENTTDAPCCSKAQCYISAFSCIAFCPRCSSCRDVLLRRLQIGHTHIACAREQMLLSRVWVVFGWIIAGRHFACRRLSLAQTELLYRLLLL